MKYLLVAETANHFRCIDVIIDHAKVALTEKFIKEIHLVLKNGTSDSRKRRETGAHQQKKRRTDYVVGYSERAEGK